MIKQLTTTSRLHKNELASIKKLVDLSISADHSKIKLYWSVLHDRQTAEFNDYLYYIDGNLVGYLALFTFKYDEAELTALVHPKYRRRGIFKKMFESAISELRSRRIPNLLIIIPKKSVYPNDRVRQLNAEYVYSQVEMCATKEPVEKNLPEISLQLATTNDVITLAKIGAESFATPFTEVLQRFAENTRDKNRKAWLVYADAKLVGKIHVRYENTKTVFIHDLCIIPQYRGQYYAMAMILKIMGLLRAEGCKMITLDVECHNEGALKLYQQCGFEITESFDFWRIPLQNLP